MMPRSGLAGFFMDEIVAVAVSERFDAVRDLAALHWRETEAHFSGSPPDLDLALYRAAEQAGTALAFAAFDGGRMVGYVSGFVVRHPHYGFVIGQHDLLFVHPDCRKGALGLRLMRRFEREAKDKGAAAVMYHAKPGTVFERILQRTGCMEEEVVYRKEL